MVCFIVIDLWKVAVLESVELPLDEMEDVGGDAYFESNELSLIEEWFQRLLRSFFGLYKHPAKCSCLFIMSTCRQSVQSFDIIHHGPQAYPKQRVRRLLLGSFR